MRLLHDTSTRLNQVVPAELLAEMLADGYVRSQVHPTLPLTIYNYTEKTTYERVWNDVTRTCRGLIVNAAGEVIARPFPKFFNHGELAAAALDLTEPAVAFDKLDGSLAISYPTSDGWAIATRGSFTSEQAIHATELLRTRYAGWSPPAGVTVLFEILYPENRIVVDYAGTDDLVLLGAVDIASGRSMAPEGVAGWPGPVAEQFPYRTLAEALAAPPRPNAEGLVVWFPATDRRVKLKQDDYVRLHRIVTGLTARVIWEHLLAGRDLAELVAPLPDEFHDWCYHVATDLENTVQTELARLLDQFQELSARLPATWQPGERAGRKQFADLAAGTADAWAMFALLDGRAIEPELLKRARPGPYLTPSGRTFTEDTA